MELQNRTLYNKELILSYNKFYLSGYVKKNFIFISAISAVFIIYMLIKAEWVYALVLGGILIFYLAMTYFMQKLTTKRLLKRSPLVEKPVMQTYLFKDNTFIVTNINSYEVPYSNIIKCKTSPTFYLLQSTDRKSYIVTFDGFDSNTDLKRFETEVIPKLNLKKKRKQAK